jgi:membrane-bound serine protease (ClpP class)
MRQSTLRAAWVLTGLLLAGLLSSGVTVHGGAVRADALAVHRIIVDGIIGPSTSRFIQRAIRDATGSEALIIQIDTPGGLLKSTEEITRAILNAPLPVIVYIAPRGGRAASAGVFITYSAHVAAMAPATHLGAATPVNVGGEGGKPDDTMARKVTNDAVANLRAMAKRRGRNADWGEKAIREAVSITEEDAVRLKVVDLLANDIIDLLRKIDGRTVETERGAVTLRTARARIIDREMDITERFLGLLSDPNIGFILMNVGTLGILVELYNPGAILPGVVGGIALILGLASFAILEVNAAGLLLILFAVLLFIADIKVPGHGVLTIGGVAAFVFGAILLTERQIPVLQISLRLIIATAAMLAGFFLLAVSAGLRAQRVPRSSGSEQLVGAIGVVRSRLDPEGQVHVRGELWTAVSVGGPVEEGRPVRVVGVEGLRVRVKPEA